MDTQQYITAPMFNLFAILAFINPTDNCHISQYGGIGRMDMGLSFGCTMACYGPRGEQVHILHDTGAVITKTQINNKTDKVLVRANELQEGVNIVLVLASYQPTSWVIQFSPAIRITSFMLISKYPLSTIAVSCNGTIINPVIVRAPYPSQLHKLGSAGNARAIFRLAEQEYGMVTSYTEAQNAWVWQLQKVIPTQHSMPCLSTEWATRPSPHTDPALGTIPCYGTPFPTVTATLSTAGSLFIGVVLTIVLGFVPLFLCLCCLCFRARRNRYPMHGAGVGFDFHHPYQHHPGAAGTGSTGGAVVMGAPPGVVLSGVEPDLPPAYELSVRPAVPPAPPDYEKVDDDLPPPYSVVVEAMKDER